MKRVEATRAVFGRRAVAGLEFALLLPLLAILIFGIVVYGAYLASWIAVTEAASEAARASLAGLSISERQALATASISQSFLSYAPMMNVQHASINFPTPAGANLFAVQVTYDFTASDFGAFASFVPLPNDKPTIVITVSSGGY